MHKTIIGVRYEFKLSDVKTGDFLLSKEDGILYEVVYTKTKKPEGLWENRELTTLVLNNTKTDDIRMFKSFSMKQAEFAILLVSKQDIPNTIYPTIPVYPQPYWPNTSPTRNPFEPYVSTGTPLQPSQTTTFRVTSTDSEENGTKWTTEAYNNGEITSSSYTTGEIEAKIGTQSTGSIDMSKTKETENDPEDNRSLIDVFWALFGPNSDSEEESVEIDTDKNKSGTRIVNDGFDIPIRNRKNK